MGDGLLHVGHEGDAVEVPAGAHDGAEDREGPEKGHVAWKDSAEQGACRQTEQAEVDDGKLVFDRSHRAETCGAEHHTRRVEQLDEACVPGRRLKMIARHQRIEGGERHVEDHPHAHAEGEGEEPAVAQEDGRAVPHLPQEMRELLPGARGIGDLHHRDRDARRDCAHQVGEQDDRKRQGGVHRGAEHRPEHKGARLHELAPAVGADELVPGHEHGDRRLDRGGVEDVPDRPDAQHEAGRPEGRPAEQEDARENGRDQAHEEVRGDDDRLALETVDPHPDERPEHQLRQEGEEPRQRHRHGGGAFAGEPPDQRELDGAAADQRDGLPGRDRKEAALPAVGLRLFHKTSFYLPDGQKDADTRP